MRPTVRGPVEKQRANLGSEKVTGGTLSSCPLDSYLRTFMKGVGELKVHISQGEAHHHNHKSGKASNERSKSSRWSGFCFWQTLWRGKKWRMPSNLMPQILFSYQLTHVGRKESKRGCTSSHQHWSTYIGVAKCGPKLVPAPERRAPKDVSNPVVLLECRILVSSECALIMGSKVTVWIAETSIHL